MGRGDSLLRQWQLLGFLQKSRMGISLRDLSDLSGYSERTIQRDLKLLCEAGFPVRHEANDYGKRFWRLPPDFIRREELMLSLTEAVGMYFARQLLSPLRGTEFAEGLDSIIAKIKAMLPDSALDHFKELSGLILVRGTGQADYAHHRKTIQKLSEAVRAQRVAGMTYKAVWRNEIYDTHIHPYGLVYFDCDLYVVGHSERSNGIRVFKVTRVQKVELTTARFKRPAHFSLEEHFHGSFGIMPATGPASDVVVEFHPTVAPLIEERQWHPSQCLERAESGWLRATYRLHAAPEFKRWILGFGDQARVLRPPGLRNEIAAALNSAAAAYRQEASAPGFIIEPACLPVAQPTRKPDMHRRKPHLTYSAK